MAGVNFNLRGLPLPAMMRLKKEAKKQNTSVNFLLIRLVEQGVGYSHKTKIHTYHELDGLAGGWSKAEAAEFSKNTVPFEKIDEELWT